MCNSFILESIGTSACSKLECGGHKMEFGDIVVSWLVCSSPN